MGPETVDWGYAISTLVIRFVGIFVVLGILQLVMQITGRVFARLDAREKDASSPSAVAAEGLTREEAAAVAMALYLYDKES
ncbi:MAG: OadG family protein [Thermodesulfobacteriota bacterium]|nr:OadG family protein [Thermodesulfobacteriota bacterium]